MNQSIISIENKINIFYMILNFEKTITLENGEEIILKKGMYFHAREGFTGYLVSGFYRNAKEVRVYMYCTNEPNATLLHEDNKWTLSIDTLQEDITSYCTGEVSMIEGM